MRFAVYRMPFHGGHGMTHLSGQAIRLAVGLLLLFGAKGLSRLLGKIRA
jgi:hypothetical protein